MRALLDTNIVIWWFADSPRLPEKYAAIITNPSNQIFISSISAAELAVKSAIGRLAPLPTSLASAIAESGAAELPFSATHADALSELPLHHRDPFDRMLIAQAIAEDLTLLATNRAFSDYPVKLA
ncbi:MAG: type II toxin-antitoxin system VapC family toxin [Propionibacteriaceae bacterium]|jgi:PIN domain nuclease of toxin-antitoxin system|nr:type II toxin-antitoxin system VapC family toxin [Propionibacteriaceae bacterium]